MDMQSKIESLQSQNDSKSLVELGIIYSQGPVEYRDYQQAISCFEKAAQDGNSDALVQLAIIYNNPYGVNVGVVDDYALSEKYLKQAMDLNNGRAFVWYAVLSNKDNCFNLSLKEQEQYLQKGQELIMAQTNHNADDLYCLSFKFKKGALIQATTLLSHASDLGFTLAMIDLANFYFDQNNPSSIKKGIIFLEKASEANSAQACFLLANCYFAGIGVKTDINYAAKMLEKSVKLGHAQSMGVLGIIYNQGAFVEKDDVKTLELWEAGERLNDTLSIKNLAHLYIDGNVVPKDIQKAEKLYQKAIDLQDADAMCSLAGFYFEGKDGFTQDKAKAKHLLEMAADLDFPLAMFILASKFYGGLQSGTPEDKDMAEKLFLRAAEQNDIASIFFLGTYYALTQKNAPRNIVKKGVALLERGVRLGDHNCKHMLGLVLCTNPLVLNKSKGKKLLSQAPNLKMPTMEDYPITGDLRHNGLIKAFRKGRAISSKNSAMSKCRV